MQGAGIGDRRGRAQGGGHHLRGIGIGDAGILVIGPVAYVQLAGDVGADVLVEVDPLAVLQHKVRAVPLPQDVAVLLLLGGEAGVDDAGGDEGGTGRLSVRRHLDNIGDQSMDGGLHEGTGVFSANFGVNFVHFQPILHGLGIVAGDRAEPHLVKAAHTAKGVGPGAVIGAGPDVVPLAGGIGTAVVIGVGRLHVLHFLAGGGVQNALMERKFTHLKFLPSPALRPLLPGALKPSGP